MVAAAAAAAVRLDARGGTAHERPDGGGGGGTGGGGSSATDQWQSGEHREPSSRGPHEAAASGAPQLAHVGRPAEAEDVEEAREQGGYA